MAKNYQAKEAYDVVMGWVTGEDKSIENLTFMSKYPALAAAIVTNDVKAILAAIPYASARQLEKKLREDASIDDATESSDDEDEEADEKPAPKARGKAKAKPAPVEEDDEDEDEEEDEDEGKYAGMKPKALYDMCVEAGLKVKPSQDAEYYIEKLEYADKKASASKGKAKAKPAPAEDDGWDEEEEEAPKGKPKSKAKGKTKDEDDEDWDF